MKKFLLSFIALISAFSLTGCVKKNETSTIQNEENVNFVLRCLDEQMTDDYVVSEISETLLQKDTTYKDNGHKGTCDLYKYTIVYIELLGENYQVVSYFLINDKENHYINLYEDDGGQLQDIIDEIFKDKTSAK